MVRTLATRRRVLQGVMGGAAVTVGLPFLDCFLDGNGAALAATGEPLPPAYGTWSWGLGFTPGRWAPAAPGAIGRFGPELAALDRFRAKINVYSGFGVRLDGQRERRHVTAPMAVLTGTAPAHMYGTAATLDTLVADRIGTTTPFRSLEMTSTGDPGDMYSYREGGHFQPGEASPAALYRRLFARDGDPGAMARNSVLSAVGDERRALDRRLGSADRARLDEHYSAIRQLETAISRHPDAQAAAATCALTGAHPYGEVGCEIERLNGDHRLFARLAALALATDRTRVVTLVFSAFLSNLRRAGSQMDHHLHTHEERVDPVLSYQPSVAWFNTRVAEGLADYLGALDGVREGAGTLLDRTLIFAMTDCGDARDHSRDSIPLLTAGSAGGRLNTGLHVAAQGQSAARVGLTIQKALGLRVDRWGTGSMETARPIAEVLA